ncbi:hypothetical protein RD792_013683 [Penstemon davidsonii]|uniref:F-box domain-containing protein n=1 Tax=Penstemon davidsonii TaxID=160366 RepID=A0ABR0CUM7_9LAMI|nr:hypothetical protein RD792_013683 [Penstemon davidsonii]
MSLMWQRKSGPQSKAERLMTAVATTGMLFRRGLSETKDKVVVGKTKVEEGVARTDVFGVPIEIAGQRQQSTTAIPIILRRCADSLILSDPNASLPDGVTSIEVAALMKCYTASLPEPLTTFELYNDIRNARSSIHVMRNILKQMDTRSLAMELAHIIMWQKRPEERYEQFWNQPSKPDFQANTDAASNYTALDMLVGMADWAALPTDICVLIAERVEFFEHFIGFCVLCKSWRSTTSILGKSRTLLSRFPWVMLTDIAEKKYPLVTRDMYPSQIDCHGVVYVCEIDDVNDAKETTIVCNCIPDGFQDMDQKYLLESSWLLVLVIRFRFRQKLLDDKQDIDRVDCHTCAFSTFRLEECHGDVVDDEQDIDRVVYLARGFSIYALEECEDNEAHHAYEEEPHHGRKKVAHFNMRL